jgi:hypothetical protein
MQESRKRGSVFSLIVRFVALEIRLNLAQVVERGVTKNLVIVIHKLHKCNSASVSLFCRIHYFFEAISKVS